MMRIELAARDLHITDVLKQRELVGSLSSSSELILKSLQHPEEVRCYVGSDLPLAPISFELEKISSRYDLGSLNTVKNHLQRQGYTYSEVNYILTKLWSADTPDVIKLKASTSSSLGASFLAIERVVFSVSRRLFEDFLKIVQSSLHKKAPEEASIIQSVEDAEGNDQADDEERLATPGLKEESLPAGHSQKNTAKATEDKNLEKSINSSSRSKSESNDFEFEPSLALTQEKEKEEFGDVEQDSLNKEFLEKIVDPTEQDVGPQKDVETNLIQTFNDTKVEKKLSSKKSLLQEDIKSDSIDRTKNRDGLDEKILQAESVREDASSTQKDNKLSPGKQNNSFGSRHEEFGGTRLDDMAELSYQKLVKQATDELAKDG